MSVAWTEMKPWIEMKQSRTFMLPSSFLPTSGATLLTVLAPKCPMCVIALLGAIGVSSEASSGIASLISLPLLLVPLIMLGKSWVTSRYDRQMLWPLLLGVLGALAIAITKLWTSPAYLAIPGAALIITALALKNRAAYKLCHPAARYFRRAQNQDSPEPFGFI